MKIRWYEEKDRFWQWDSRDDAWYLRESNKVSKHLQYYHEEKKKWLPVPAVVWANDPGPKPKN